MNSISNKASSLKSELEYKIRKQPYMRNTIYPWNNYDFDLNTYIEKKYNPSKLGFSNAPYLDTFIKDMTKLPKYPELITKGPIMDSSTVSGNSDVKEDNTEVLQIKQKYNEWKEPYPGFKKEYPNYFPLTGDRASSYFVQIGYCPVKSKTTKKDCSSTGFNWVPDTLSLPDGAKEFFPKQKAPSSGKCYKPRYMYINNQTKPFLGMKGPVGSLANDIKDINPLDLLGIFTNGESSNKEMRPLPCIESFETYTSTHSNTIYYIIILLILFSLGIYYLIRTPSKFSGKGSI